MPKIVVEIRLDITLTLNIPISRTMLIPIISNNFLKSSIVPFLSKNIGTVMAAVVNKINVIILDFAICLTSKTYLNVKYNASANKKFPAASDINSLSIS